VAPDLLAEALAIVVLGAGEAKYEKALHDLAKKYPEKLSVKIAYDNAIAHRSKRVRTFFSCRPGMNLAA